MFSLFFGFTKLIENHQNVFFLNFPAPWQETFADARDGDGGDHLGPFWKHLVTILYHFGFILGPI